MKTPIIVNGATGKMGEIACQTLKNHPDFELVACLNSQDSLGDAIVKTNAAVVVDLTRADCVYINTKTIIENHAHPVIGTSGLLEHQIQELTRLCNKKKLGGIIVPNFSISAVLMMRFAAIAAKFLSEVEIIEMHHQGKLDAPSGTAIKTADIIAKARAQPKNKVATRELISGARGAAYDDINIHSLRLPGVLARQQVIFGNTGETLTISHDSLDRASFMPGLILACQQVIHLNTLYYGLEHFMDKEMHT